MIKNSSKPSDFGSVGRYSLGRPNVMASATKSMGGSHIPRMVKTVRDPRNKEHYEKQCKILREFLELNDAQFDFETVIKPSMEHFSALFMFIYTQLDPDFDFDNKTYVQVIPKIFAGLKYPLPIKTSTMQTISAQHCWPYVIDALAWLAEYVTQLKTLQVFDINSSEDFLRTQTYHFLTKCYQKRNSVNFNPENPDPFAEEKESFYQSILKQMVDHNKPIQNKETLEEELKVLKENSHEKEYELFELECGRLKNDISSLKEYHKKADAYIACQTQERVDILAEIERVTKLLESVEAENSVKQEQIQNQTISAREAREKTRLFTDLRERLRSLKTERDECQQEQSSKQGVLFKNLNSTEKLVAEIGEEIAKHAEKYFTKEEFFTNGFAILRENRSMGLEVIKERMEIYESLLKLLLTKMDAYAEKTHQEVIAGKEAANDYHKRLKNIERQKFECDEKNWGKKLALQGKFEELNRKQHEIKLELELLTKKRDLEGQKKNELERENLYLVNKLAEKEMNIIHKIEQYKKEFTEECDESYKDLSDTATKFFEMSDKLDENAEISTKLVADYMDLLRKVEELPSKEDDST
uniref:Kinetochore protein NDC80 n=1 Tax=Panagrolaimus sp. JU765 TaxID=591449 RepID=A0AC34QBY8_9BILA